MAEIAALREENIDLRQMMGGQSKKNATVTVPVTNDDTFITKGAENPNVNCENW